MTKISRITACTAELRFAGKAYNSNYIATGAPEAAGGFITVSQRPGLGVEPDFDALGDPAWVSS